MAETAQGMVFEIQRASLQDGPGVRTTVFLKGCPLRCLWCHNPESISPLPQTAVHPSYPGGRKTYGRAMGTGEVLEEVLKDRGFYALTGGGMTISGGEPLAQPAFTLALARAAKEEGLDVCVQTSGRGARSSLAALLPLVDLFHFDYKATGEAEHVRLCGSPQRPILENLEFLLGTGARVVLRCPLIPGHNDGDAHLEAIRRLDARHPELEGVELLPYHNTGNDKARKLGMDIPIDGLASAGPGHKDAWKSALRSKGCLRAEFAA